MLMVLKYTCTCSEFALCLMSLAAFIPSVLRSKYGICIASIMHVRLFEPILEVTHVVLHKVGPFLNLVRMHDADILVQAQKLKLK